MKQVRFDFNTPQMNVSAMDHISPLVEENAEKKELIDKLRKEKEVQ